MSVWPRLMDPALMSLLLPAAIATEAAPAAIGPDAFKAGMRRLAGGVAIVATEHQGVRQGLLVSAVTSVSSEPPTLLISLNRTASCRGPVLDSGRFTVNLLGRADRATAELFGDPRRRAQRFATRRWAPLLTGAPALEGCLATLDCRVQAALEMHSHSLVFGNVVEVMAWTDTIDPLLYWNGDYGTADRRDRPRPGLAEAPEGDAR